MATSLLCSLTLNSPNSNLRLPNSAPRHVHSRTQTAPPIRCAKRTGKQRYPSEKKKLKLIHKQALGDVKDKFEGLWRLSKLSVSVHTDPGKDFLGVSDGLLQQIAKVLEFPVASMLPPEAFSVVRKSFDARKVLKEPKFVYTVDVDVSKLLSLEPRTWDFISRLEPKVGLVEHMPDVITSGDLISIVQDCKNASDGALPLKNISHGSEGSYKYPTIRKPKVAVVGSGPSGFSSHSRTGEQFLLWGGTWSDGKLVTRIGRNSDSVLAVMNTLVHFGAPKNILVNGKPHLGTDKLIPLLRNFRQHLQRLGVTIKFGTRVDDLMIENAHVVGVKVSGSKDKSHQDFQKLGYDAVILAVGHSARDIYQMLLSHNMNLVPKDFAVGLRIEHPQELINSIQYSGLASEVHNGSGKVPVADYKVIKYVSSEDGDTLVNLGATSRSCYSFCMCPGGQVVLTSTNPSELCINGMSFSRRSSKWANAALVVNVSANDFDALNFHGPLAGVEFQREFERRAATMGGGNFVVPVQTVTDFLENKLSATPVPPSSYRLGVKAANLHELFPTHITDTLKHSISMFDKELPGFISKAALLHGVETRTSSPLQIPRCNDTYESTSLKGLYPVGEGAGYAGGIVSAAVDGMYAGFAVAKNLALFSGDIESVLGKAQGLMLSCCSLKPKSIPLAVSTKPLRLSTCFITMDEQNHCRLILTNECQSRIKDAFRCPLEVARSSVRCPLEVARCRDVCAVESNVWGNQNEMVGDVTKLGDIIPVINYGKGKMVSDGGILNVINDKKENSNDKKFITSCDNREEKMIAIRPVGGYKLGPLIEIVACEEVKRKREKITKLNRKTIQFVEPRRCRRSRRIRQTSPGCRTSRLLWTFGRIRHCRSSNPPDLSPNQLLLVVDAVTVAVAPHSSIFKSG
ncbi:hypothetical protein LWI29_034261 [Acer saccharum]|uniref:FAD-dependent protein C-terminal domain-containing protein n=1 Tax=Acer saccharum TaxID=4024 RepID=A0AA39RHM5_ACESA|nr:hypothetical protein LWI29_034261 [Acer saccharum]